MICSSRITINLNTNHNENYFNLCYRRPLIQLNGSEWIHQEETRRGQHQWTRLSREHLPRWKRIRWTPRRLRSPYPDCPRSWLLLMRSRFRNPPTPRRQRPGQRLPAIRSCYLRTGCEPDPKHCFSHQLRSWVLRMCRRERSRCLYCPEIKTLLNQRWDQHRGVSLFPRIIRVARTIHWGKPQISNMY